MSRFYKFPKNPIPRKTEGTLSTEELSSCWKGAGSKNLKLNTFGTNTKASQTLLHINHEPLRPANVILGTLSPTNRSASLSSLFRSIRPA